MKHILQNSGKYLLVEVPEDTKEYGFKNGLFCTRNERLGIETIYPEVDMLIHNKKLYPCAVIGLASEITEEVAAGIVELDGVYYRDFEYKAINCRYFVSAIDSFISLIRHHLPDAKNVVILKVNE